MVELLCFDLDVPYWTSFTNPIMMNRYKTYKVPPPTAILGLLCNAFGLPQQETLEEFSERQQREIFRNALGQNLTFVEFRDSVEIYILVLKFGEVVVSYSNILKIDSHNPGNKPYYLHTPLLREKIIQPRFRVLMKSSKAMLERIATQLQAPKRPLYLGESDDLIVIAKPFSKWIVDDAKENITQGIVAEVVKGIHGNAELEQLPIRFHRKRQVDYEIEKETFSIKRL